MEWLNYHHLIYFHTVAECGNIALAAAKLHLSQPTISVQLKALEKALGVELFERRGRKLILSEAGRRAFRYADEIVSLGRELREGLRGQADTPTFQLSVGIADVLHKLVVVELLKPALALPEQPRLKCVEGSASDLLNALAQYELDLVLSDQPGHGATKSRAFAHALGESAVAFFGATKWRGGVCQNFPNSLAEVPLLLPAYPSTMRRALDAWFDARDWRPRIVGEFTDSALLKAFGQQGLGIFPAPAIIAAEVQRQYQVEHLGTLEDVREKYYALSPERRVKHPAVLAITSQAWKFTSQEDPSA